MRIIAGEQRGRRLVAPKGDGTRPTTDRVRESLFSALGSARGGLDGAVVLDAFAGSGALGLEALSRGAVFACLCERAPAALRAIEQNIAALGHGPDRARMVRCDVLKASVPRPPAAAADSYDLLFLDPPYALGADDALGLAAVLDGRSLLARHALISYEHAAADDGAVDAAIERLLAPFGFALRSRRAHGDIALDILER